MSEMSNRLKHKIAYQLDTANGVLEEFAAHFALNPFNAFNWGDNAIQAAATKIVWQQIEGEHLKGATIEDLARTAQDSVLREARDEPLSSFAMRNATQRYRMKAVAMAAQELRFLVEAEAKATVRLEQGGDKQARERRVE